MVNFLLVVPVADALVIVMRWQQRTTHKPARRLKLQPGWPVNTVGRRHGVSGGHVSFDLGHSRASARHCASFLQ